MMNKKIYTIGLAILALLHTSALYVAARSEADRDLALWISNPFSATNLADARRAIEVIAKANRIKGEQLTKDLNVSVQQLGAPLISNPVANRATIEKILPALKRSSNTIDKELANNLQKALNDAIAPPKREAAGAGGVATPRPVRTAREIEEAARKAREVADIERAIADSLEVEYKKNKQEKADRLAAQQRADADRERSRSEAEPVRTGAGGTAAPRPARTVREAEEAARKARDEEERARADLLSIERAREERKREEKQKKEKAIRDAEAARRRTAPEDERAGAAGKKELDKKAKTRMRELIYSRQGVLDEIIEQLPPVDASEAFRVIVRKHIADLGKVLANIDTISVDAARKELERVQNEVQKIRPEIEELRRDYEKKAAEAPQHKENLIKEFTDSLKTAQAMLNQLSGQPKMLEQASLERFAEHVRNAEIILRQLEATSPYNIGVIKAAQKQLNIINMDTESARTAQKKYWTNQINNVQFPRIVIRAKYLADRTANLHSIKNVDHARKLDVAFKQAQTALDTFKRGLEDILKEINSAHFDSDIVNARYMSLLEPFNQSIKTSLAVENEPLEASSNTQESAGKTKSEQRAVWNDYIKNTIFKLIAYNKEYIENHLSFLPSYPKNADYVLARAKDLHSFADEVELFNKQMTSLLAMVNSPEFDNEAVAKKFDNYNKVFDASLKRITEGRQLFQKAAENDFNERAKAQIKEIDALSQTLGDTEEDATFRRKLRLQRENLEYFFFTMQQNLLPLALKAELLQASEEVQKIRDALTKRKKEDEKEAVAEHTIKTAEALFEYLGQHSPESAAVQVVKTALDAGVTINTQDEDGFTFLMIAIVNHNQALVQLLFARGADLTVENNEGKNALQVAYQVQAEDSEPERYNGIIALLQKATADLEATTKKRAAHQVS